jgi:hypothetical protein
MRMVNECLILNNTNLAKILGRDAQESIEIKNTLPAWVLFFNIAAYDYFPEERIKGQLVDMAALTQQIGVEPVKVLGQVAAGKVLGTLNQPSVDPYWKLREKGACQDIFFLTIYDKLNDQLKAMYEAADSVGFSASDIGVYLQPVVQGTSCHCEFNLFYDPENTVEKEKAKKLTLAAVKALLAKGAFFSRPYGETTGMIMNRDTATVECLKKVKKILDPANIMNPGKLCF